MQQIRNVSHNNIGNKDFSLSILAKKQESLAQKKRNLFCVSSTDQSVKRGFFDKLQALPVLEERINLNAVLKDILTESKEDLTQRVNGQFDSFDET